MTDFLISPEFLNVAVYGTAAAIAIFLYFAGRAGLRSMRRPDTRSIAGRYMIAHRIDELTPGGME